MILLKAVSRYYETSRQWAVRDVTLRIDAGSFVFITGPSGSGKTTLLNLISGLDRPTSGEIEFEGQGLTELGDRRLSEFRNRKIGFIFQTFYLNPRWSLARNVALPLMIAGVRESERLRRAAEILDRLGLGGLASQDAGTLSAGQKQRAVIARAIIHGPSTILADEPIANLDSELAAVVLATLRRLADSGVTVIAVQHRLQDAHVADRTVQIRGGRLVE